MVAGLTEDYLASESLIPQYVVDITFGEEAKVARSRYFGGDSKLCLDPPSRCRDEEDACCRLS